MHFTFDVSIGQVATVLAILGVGWRISTKMNVFLIEHELLMKKYCDDLGIELNELPTRSRRR